MAKVGHHCDVMAGNPAWGRAGQGRAGQGTASRQGRAGHSIKAGQGRASRQGRAQHQGRAQQGRARQGCIAGQNANAGKLA